MTSWMLVGCLPFAGKNGSHQPEGRFCVRPKTQLKQKTERRTMKKHIALLLAVSTLFLAGCSTSHHAVIWEYQTARSLSEVNELAADGWIVVGFTQYAEANWGSHQAFLLKRPKQ